MDDFIRGTLGDDVWDMIKNRYAHPTHPIFESNPTRIKKLLSEFTNEEKKASLDNNKGKNAIVDTKISQMTWTKYMTTRVVLHGKSIYPPKNL